MAHELATLNRQQQRAVTASGNVVVRAGPGSGKTRTLVARAGYLLETSVSRFRGVACITYTNSAADEVRTRLQRLGVAAEQRLTCSTLHAFCLNSVLRAHASITGVWLPGAGQVLDDAGAMDLLQRCFDELGIADLQARYRTATATKIRRTLACNEPTDTFDPREVQAARLYENKLVSAGTVDFEAMVIQALHVVRSHEAVRDLLRARYPHLIVDEYQDLGGVLHQLVTTLHDHANITVSAVGDADQTVFGFTGADPRYIDNLASRPDFMSVDLEVNYRSGQAIIDASEAALGHHGRGRRAAEGRAAGVVEVTPVEGGLDAHAAYMTSAIASRLAAGVPHERIAVLYLRRGPVLAAISQEFERTAIPVLFEKDEQLPPGTLSLFVQRCASRAVASALGHQSSSAAQTVDLLSRAEAPDLFALERQLVRLRQESGLPQPPGRLALLRALQRALDPLAPIDPAGPALPWLLELSAGLDLHPVAAQHPDRQNSRALVLLVDACRDIALTVQDLAATVQVLGKVVLTNYHTAKGREWDTVVLPGLVNGLVPADVPTGSSWGPPIGAELAEQRRTFFVAVSRAQTELHCLTGAGYHTPWGRWIERGPSDFLVEMESRRRHG